MGFSTPASTCPFVAGGMITDPRLFVGRESELHFLSSRMTGAQVTSVNVYGPRRTGKSSLVYHFYSTWPEMVADPGNYAVAFLDLKNDPCHTSPEFYQKLATALRDLPTVRGRPDLADPLRNIRKYGDFESALQAWKVQKVRPVFCLDEFQVITSSAEFTNDFYNGLRALLNRSLLMLVLVTHDPLGRLRQKDNSTSPFFNLGLHIQLGDLKDDEVKKLLALPSPGADADSSPCLTTDEQNLARQWAGNHPYALALAAKTLFHLRHAGSMEKARQSFVREISNVSSMSAWWRISHLPILNEIFLLMKRVGTSAFPAGNASK
ncbi:MAG: ATP-binding protein [Magnetococcales bacterium]|nr:ATP-binding protein [Magnetococcales bacterium]